MIIAILFEIWGLVMLNIGWYGWRMTGEWPSLAFGICGIGFIMLGAKVVMG